jgi:hypothetical protein
MHYPESGIRSRRLPRIRPSLAAAGWRLEPSRGAADGGEGGARGGPIPLYALQPTLQPARETG